MYLLQARQAAPTVNQTVDSPESRCLRQRHAEHILDLMRDGISMRTIRRHRLDDPRLTDEVRAILVLAHQGATVQGMVPADGGTAC